MTKGILVLIMVAYHTLNYSSEYYLGFRYLYFLPPSFILISGFIISKIYSQKYDAHDKRMHVRLLTRGLKLFLTFTALNVALQLFLGRNRHGQSAGPFDFFLHSWEIYISGSRGDAAFGVLLPIAYMLMIAPAIIMWTHWKPTSLFVLTFLICTLCAYFEEIGVAGFNLNLLAAGVCGMLLGTISDRWLAKLPALLVPSLVVYLASFHLAQLYGRTFVIQLVGAIAALGAIFSYSLMLREKGVGSAILGLLGRYSLVAYIVQIAALQVLSILVRRPYPISLGSLFLIAGTTSIMIVSVWLLDRWRSRYLLVKQLYKAFFA